MCGEVKRSAEYCVTPLGRARGPPKSAVIGGAPQTRERRPWRAASAQAHQPPNPTNQPKTQTPARGSPDSGPAAAQTPAPRQPTGSREPGAPAHRCDSVDSDSGQKVSLDGWTDGPWLDRVVRESRIARTDRRLPPSGSGAHLWLWTGRQMGAAWCGWPSAVRVCVGGSKWRRHVLTSVCSSPRVCC